MLKLTFHLTSVIACCVIFAGCGGNEEPAVKLPAGNADRGKEFFAKTCAMCHGADGNAKTSVAERLGVKKLTDPTRMAAFTNEDIVNIIQNGKGKMPGFGKKMTPQELSDTIEFVRSLSK